MPNADQVILITGASTGLGAQVAREAARSGARLVLTARRQDRLEELARETRAAGAGDVLTLAADLASTDAPGAIIDATLGRFSRLDVLINNAGLGLPQPFHLAEPDQLRHQIAVNLIAPLLLTRKAIPSLVEARGTIINIGSAITTIAIPMFGAYGMTKAGLAYWNDALRRELKASSVSVCLVEPGPIGTDFFKAISALYPDDGADPNAASLRAARGPAISPPPHSSADVQDVARRIVRLIDHPRRRISVLRRTVWPLRIAGAIFDLCPPLGDLALSRVIRRIESEFKPR